MSANETQIGGTHYKDMAVQPWDAMRAWMTAEQFAGYLLGNVIKYASRHRSKGGIEDLRKARHYLDKLIETKEVMQAEPAHRPSGSNTATPPAADSLTAGDTDRGGFGEAPYYPYPVISPDWPGPDWSQAPEWVMWWVMDRDGRCSWSNHKPFVYANSYWASLSTTTTAPNFGYTGDWRDSLRKRPE